MHLADRLGYALIGFISGAFLGVVCWWLYGLAFSLRYDGPGIDPILQHWVKYCGGAFAVIGFLFRDKAADALGNVLGAIFHFETDQTPTSHVSVWVSILALVLIVLAIWYGLGRGG